MKQTAIEWLIEQIEGTDSKIARVIGLKKYNEIVQQAKAMEKEQMNEIHLDGIEQGYNMRYQQEKQKNN
jgi:hypothetical protein